MYHSSLKKGGDFANNIISNVARGSYSQVGSIKGDEAEKAYISYMGLTPDANLSDTHQTFVSHAGTTQNFTDQGTANQTSIPPNGTSPTETGEQESVQPMPAYTNIEIGGGRITGTEITSDSGSRNFALYHTDQYMAPTKGTYDTVQSVDGATWYKQYVGGEFIQISPASRSCINIMEIRKVDNSVNELLDGPTLDASALASKIYGVPSNHVRAWQSKVRKQLRQDRELYALLA